LAGTKHRKLRLSKFLGDFVVIDVRLSFRKTEL
jgi:hypothetical protein